jgi:hypothetical protein
VRDRALEHRFPTWHKAVVKSYVRRKERAFGSFTKIFDRAKLDFHFARFRHSRIGAVEWTIGLGAAAPAGKHSCRGERGGRPLPVHGAGRNTQIAAGSFDCARTATNSRSSSGTKSEVRAPDTVGTRARCR